LSASGVADEHRDQGTQKRGKPAEQQGEVVAGCGKDGVDAVAVAAFDIIAVHAVLGLDMADDWLHGGAALHLAADGSGDAPDLAADPDAGFDAGELFQIGDYRPEGVAVEGVAVQRLGMQPSLDFARDEAARLWVM
jgi:hypothetical protein